MAAFHVRRIPFSSELPAFTPALAQDTLIEFVDEADKKQLNQFTRNGAFKSLHKLQLQLCVLPAINKARKSKANIPT